jgi:hypothetical protein
MLKSRVSAVLAIALLATSIPAAVAAKPAKPSFGPGIDPSPGYVGQRKCSPNAKPGVLAFQRLVMRAYPGTGYGSISRGCSIGGTSEHKEGRAWDWGVNARKLSQKRAAEDLFEWLFAKDARGNGYAMARRLGVMYLIFNRRIWFPGSGWRVYCRQKPRGCVAPGGGGLRHPHDDHVHFSFTWAGAMKKTTFWKPSRSMIAGIAGHPGSAGSWAVAGNGAVFTDGTSYYGSRAHSWLKRPVVGMASTPTGGGYWLLRSDGRVMAFGNAVKKGEVKSNSIHVVGMSPTPDGRGYWMVTRSGRVLAFGNATSFGGAKDSGATMADIAATPTGDGYWLFATDGRVFAFGDATHHGNASNVRVAGGDNHGSDGYWVVTERGRVRAFGGADVLGDAAENKPGSKVVGLAATPTGDGYVLVTAKGKIFRFGDAAL